MVGLFLVGLWSGFEVVVRGMGADEVDDMLLHRSGVRRSRPAGLSNCESAGCGAGDTSFSIMSIMGCLAAWHFILDFGIMNTPSKLVDFSSFSRKPHPCSSVRLCPPPALESPFRQPSAIAMASKAFATAPPAGASAPLTVAQTSATTAHSVRLHLCHPTYHVVFHVPVREQQVQGMFRQALERHHDAVMGLRARVDDGSHVHQLSAEAEQLDHPHVVIEGLELDEPEADVAEYEEVAELRIGQLCVFAV